jgi:HEAT repeat protein
VTTREIDELFTQTLSGGYDDEEPWEAIQALRHIGTREVFERAAEWCQSPNPLARARGADVLAQLGKTTDHPCNSFPEESYAALEQLVRRETEPQPLASAITGLGHLDNPLAIPLIAKFVSHPDAAIRFDVACALGCFPNDPVSAENLLRLMRDVDKDVRDWATFGLGVLGSDDTPEIREALLRCLNDSDEDVWEEAMVGLGKRKDRRVLPALLTALEKPLMTDRIIEAAYLMLGMDKGADGWTAADYATALRRNFVSDVE